MSVLAYLVLVVLLLGVGVLVASLLPTGGARIGLGAVLFLALVIDGMWFIGPQVGWSLALGDAVWLGVFGLVSLGAVSAAIYYQNAVNPSSWEWPSERDIACMAVVIVLFAVVIAILPVPLDTDAQGFGYLALTLREGGDYTTLAPWHPETDYLYSPGYIGLIAHLSARFDVGIHSLQLIFSAAVMVLFVWTAYDLGNELEGPRTGRALMLAALIGTGLITAFFDSHFTALLALTFSLAFITFVLRFVNTWRWSSALFAAVCLAAVPLTQPDTTIALIIGYVPWLVVVWLARPRPSVGAWLVLAAVIPLVALGILSPWLAELSDLLGSDIESPFQVDLDHWKTLIVMHGGVIVLLALIGLLIGLRRRTPAQLLMIIWLVGIVEFSTLGLLEENFPTQMEPLLKYDYPFSLAWHGPVIPYLVLGGLALVWLADRLGAARVDRAVAQLALPGMAVILLGLTAAVVFYDPLLETSKDVLNIYGAFSSRGDVAAMRWLRDNAPEDARILNHPGPYEGDWAPVISERDTIYFRPQPFFQQTQAAEAEQDALRAFWSDPADPDNADLLAEHGVSYVLVPEIFAAPASYDEALRWRSPIPEAASYRAGDVADAPYLQLVYEQDGAQVYQVVPLP